MLDWERIQKLVCVPASACLAACWKSRSGSRGGVGGGLGLARIAWSRTKWAVQAYLRRLASSTGI